jgi:CBS-domain-containing membrane protein
MTKMNDALAGPVSEWMVSPVVSFREDLPLAKAAAQLEALGVSALPVLDVNGRLTGVLGRAELRNASRLVEQSPERQRHWRLPDARVAEYMNPRVPVIRRDLALRACARRMLNQRLHRLYVAEDGPLEGVVSTREMLSAVVCGQLEVPLGVLAQRFIATISADDPLERATARLAADPSLTLVVLRAGAAVGVLTQEAALLSRQANPNEAVQLWMDTSVVSAPADSSAVTGAQRLLELGRSYIVIHEGRSVIGLISGLGFAELVAESASA